MRIYPDLNKHIIQFQCVVKMRGVRGEAYTLHICMFVCIGGPAYPRNCHGQEEHPLLPFTCLRRIYVWTMQQFCVYYTTVHIAFPLHECCWLSGWIIFRTTLAWKRANSSRKGNLMNWQTSSAVWRQFSLLRGCM